MRHQILLLAAGLVETLQGKGPFTIFAPTDAAFAKLPKGTVETLLKDPEKLKSILLYHAVEGAVYSGDAAFCPELIELGRGADALILECSYPDEYASAHPDHLTPSQAVRIAAEVKGFDAGAVFGTKDARRMDRFTQFAVAGAAQAGHLQPGAAGRDAVQALRARPQKHAHVDAGHASDVHDAASP